MHLCAFCNGHTINSRTSGRKKATGQLAISSLSETHTHTHTHTHKRFTALWNLSGTTRVSRYQKKHSPTHTHRGHQSSLSAFSIYYDPWHGLPLGWVPSTSYSIHFFIQSLSSFRSTWPYKLVFLSTLYTEWLKSVWNPYSKTKLVTTLLTDLLWSCAESFIQTHSGSRSSTACSTSLAFTVTLANLNAGGFRVLPITVPISQSVSTLIFSRQ